jgi:hypothetical protein
VDRLCAFGGVAREGDEAMTHNMWNAFIMLGGILLFAAIVTLLDWLRECEELQSRNRAA